MSKRFVRQFALIGLYLLAPFLVLPVAAVTLEWDPNTETNLAGYKVYYGLASRNYTWTNQVNAPLTTAIISNLQVNQTYFFAVTAFDTDGLESEYSDEVSTTLTDATLTNSTPVAISALVQSFEDQPRSILLTGTDADGDSLQFVVVSLPSHGNLTGIVPNLTYTPASGFYGIDSFQFIATDGRTNSAPATIFLVVGAIDAAPTLDTISNLMVNEDSGATVVNLSGISSGVDDEVQALTVTAFSSDPSLVPNPTVSYFSPKGTGTLTFTPVADASGTATVTVKVNDGSSSFSRLFTVSVNAVNDPPTLDPISNLSVNEDGGATAVGLSGISSGASNEDQTLTVTASSINPTLIPNPTVSYFSPDSTGMLTFTPVADAWGTAIIIVTVNDGRAVNRTFRHFFYVTVNPVNDPPTVDAGADQIVALPATALLTGSAANDGFPNPPGGLTATWSKLSGPGTVTFSAQGSAISTASFSQPGQYVLRLSASDGALSATDDVRVDVLDGNAPIISDLGVVAMDARMVTISLRTDEPAICSVESGVTTSLGATNVETTLATNHIIVLTNLQPATNYFIRIQASDAGGNASVTDTFTVTTPPVVLMAWAADAGTLVYPMLVGSDALGAFVWSPNNHVGAVSFDVHVPAASQYRVWCQVRTFAPDVGSFYLSVDDGAEFIFDAASSEGHTDWRWIAVNDVNSPVGTASPWSRLLSPGLHRFVFRANEVVTLLHQVILSNDSDWVPH